VLNSPVEYTTIPVYRDEVVVPADSAELAAFPFLFMTGQLLVRFSQRERDGLRRFVEGGGLLFSDDCNHDIDGLYARTFEQEMRTVFGRAGILYSNKDYGCEWDYDWRNKRFRRDDNTRFAVNIAVYALTS
jgi:hypothetical protein